MTGTRKTAAEAQHEADVATAQSKRAEADALVHGSTPKKTRTIGPKLLHHAYLPTDGDVLADVRTFGTLEAARDWAMDLGWKVASGLPGESLQKLIADAEAARQARLQERS